MKLIAVCPELHARGPGDYQALEREVRRTMGPKDGSVNSASGMTAALAINYCERLGLPYRVTCDGLSGLPMRYYVERI